MDTILFVAFNQVMRGQQPVNSLNAVFENLTINENDTNVMKETMLDVIWYLDSTILDGQHNTSDLRNKLATIARYIFVSIFYFSTFISFLVINIKQYTNNII